MKKIVSLICLMFILHSLFPQAKTRMLPRNINPTSYSSYYPAISGDANSMVYMSNYTDTGKGTMMYSSKINASEWKDPVLLPNIINIEHLLFEGGYALNFDGTKLYFTFKKSGGFGGFDLWTSSLAGSSWQAGENMGKNINTAANEGMPSISFDGEKLYFCRCETMTNTTADNCKILVASKRGQLWDKTEELPANVNAYSPMSPKIMADGETLIFSSKHGGSADLYITRKEAGNSWSDPIPMNFINTTDDEQFVSIAVKGRYLYHDIKTDQGRAIEQLLIPDEFKGKDVMHVKGSVIDKASGEGMDAIIKVYELESRERILLDQIDAGHEFNFALKAGGVYDFSIETNDNSYTYFSKIYDLTEMESSPRDEIEAELEPCLSGTILEPRALVFEPMGSEISDYATYELRRLSRFLKNYTNNNFEIQVHRYDYFEDSVASVSDLTEVIADTTWNEREKVIQLADTTMVATDSTLTEPQITYRDSVVLERYYDVKYTYHNDRTQKQADNLKAFFIENGITEERISIKTSRSGDSPPRDVAEIVVKLKML